MRSYFMTADKIEYTHTQHPENVAGGFPPVLFYQIIEICARVLCIVCCGGMQIPCISAKFGSAPPPGILVYVAIYARTLLVHQQLVST